MSKTTKRRFGRQAAIATLIGCAAVTAACSNGANSSVSGGGESANTTKLVAQAKLEVTKAEAGTETWTGPTDSPPAVPNKTIVAVSVAPSVAVVDQGVSEAAKAIGWNYKTIAADGTPQSIVSAFSNAINQRPDGIILEVVPLSLVADQLAQATKLGIPVVEVQSGEDVPKSGFPVKGGVFADVSANLRALGEIGAWMTIAQTNGAAQVGVVSDTTFPSIQKRLDGFKKVLSNCSGCTIVKEINVPIANIATEMAPTVTSFLIANPKVNVMYSTYDAQGVYIVQAINTLGKQDKVSMVSADGAGVNMDYIRSGNVQIGDVAYDLAFMGWAAVDQMNRAFAGKPPATEWSLGGGGIGQKLITKRNLLPVGDAFTNSFDYKAELRKLWNRN